MTIVIVILETCPGAAESGANDLPTVRKASVRVIVAEAADELITPSAVVTAPAGIIAAMSVRRLVADATSR